MLQSPIEMTTVPSISAEVHAADSHEREVEDLFRLRFEGHPRLGDFILHDQIWQESMDPMRKRFAANQVHSVNAVRTCIGALYWSFKIQVHSPCL